MPARTEEGAKLARVELRQLPANESVQQALTQAWLALGSAIDADQLRGLTEYTLRAVTQAAISERQKGYGDLAFLRRLRHEWNLRLHGGAL